MRNAELSMQPSDGFIKGETRVVWQLKTTHQETPGRLFCRERELGKRSWLTGKISVTRVVSRGFSLRHRSTTCCISAWGSRFQQEQGTPVVTLGWHCCQENTQQNSFIQSPAFQSFFFHFRMLQNLKILKFPMKLNGQKKCFANEQGVSCQ